jgi:YgiT-type zinc finger domain-containing protein
MDDKLAILFRCSIISAMNRQHEALVEQNVTYTLLKDGKIYIIENVPARVDVNTGEQYFSPKTVERLQQIVWGQRKPVRVLQTPVYEFAT